MGTQCQRKTTPGRQQKLFYKQFYLPTFNFKTMPLAMSQGKWQLL